ncbi:UNVERIFIED_CONTAM: hypothetical protein PYX00_011677 [Menopon gallinae]|uniref:Uncharacterized protein n=1 Tax=Menopon gallinae TaxID=328185 RepID=A0AAW2H895_9NEOP
MKNAHCFFFKTIVNTVFANTALFQHSQKTIANIALVFLLVGVNVPALIYTLQSDIYMLTRKAYSILLGLTMGIEAILHITFYFHIRSPFTIPHSILSLILDFLVFFFRKKAKARDSAPSFETGRCRVPVVVNSKLKAERGGALRRFKPDRGGERQHHIAACPRVNFVSAAVPQAGCAAKSVPMDLEALAVQLSKNPENYEDEYRQVLRAYESMADLPVQNFARIKPLIDLLSQHVFKIKTEFPSVAIRHLQTTTSTEVRRELVKLVVRLYQRRAIAPPEFLRLYMDHSDRLEVNVATQHCTPECLPVFFDYLERGSDRQKCLSLLMVANLYENADLSALDGGAGHAGALEKRCIDILVSNLFTVPKLINIAVLYFLNEIDFCTSDAARIVAGIGFARAEELCRQLLRNIQARADPREMRIKKYRVISTLKRHHGLGIRIGAHLLRLVDPTKEDLKDVLRIILDSVDESEVCSVIDRIVDTFCCEHKDEDFIVYGLNVLREFAARFDVGEYIKERVGPRLGKSKAVRYAHSLLAKVIKKQAVEAREVDYVKRRPSKEEVLQRAQEGRSERRLGRRAARKARRGMAPGRRRGAARKRLVGRQKGRSRA